LNLEPESAFISGVADLLVQALDKFMDNAASFCPVGAGIELGLAAVDDGWAISVENDGPPLPPEMQHRLFEPMVSLRTQTDEGVHLGLGLHVARLIGEFHGGSVAAQNRSSGNGVRFSLQLPALSPDDLSREPGLS
jgi:signal transduction histidine kinase